MVRQSPLKSTQSSKEFSVGLAKRSLVGQRWGGWGDPGGRQRRMSGEAGETAKTDSAAVSLLEMGR